MEDAVAVSWALARGTVFLFLIRTNINLTTSKTKAPRSNTSAIGIGWQTFFFHYALFSIMLFFSILKTGNVYLGSWSFETLLTVQVYDDGVIR